MIFEGTATLQAPRGAIWDCLLDVSCFAACMPGVEEVTQVDDKTFDGSMTASVGPVSGKFTFRASIVESKPPSGLAAHVEGADTLTKSALSVDLTMTLEELSAGQTSLGYRATVDVKGRLAILGDMILRATAGLMLDGFITRLRQKVEDEAQLQSPCHSERSEESMAQGTDASLRSA